MAAVQVVEGAALSDAFPQPVYYLNPSITKHRVPAHFGISILSSECPLNAAPPGVAAGLPCVDLGV